MNITLDLLRNELFLKGSCYFQWTKSASGISHDPFISEIFKFLTLYPETKSDYEKIIENGTSHSIFCKGKLRSDGYYPLRNINEKVYCCLFDTYISDNELDTSCIINDISYGYQKLSMDFATEIHANSAIFKNYICSECFYGILPLLNHIENLLNQNQIYTVLAWMTVIAIFPIPQKVSDKHPNYTKMLAKNIFQYDIENVIAKEVPSLHNAVEQFLIEKLNSKGTINEVNLAFNHGLRWLTNSERAHLLLKIIEHANHVNILITEYPISEEFTKHIRKPDIYYISSYLSPQKMWSDFYKEHSNKITLKISSIPALRQYVEFNFEEKALSGLYVGFYTYGGFPFDKSHFLILPYGANYYDLYQNEFHYLWNKAKNIEITESKIK